MEVLPHGMEIEFENCISTQSGLGRRQVYSGWSQVVFMVGRAANWEIRGPEFRLAGTLALPMVSFAVLRLRRSGPSVSPVDLEG